MPVDRQTTKVTPCHNHVFAPNAVFCRKHHEEAKAEYEAGCDIKAKYPDWDPDFDEEREEVKPTTRPLAQFVKPPTQLAVRMDSDGGARFKKAYVPNLKAAYGNIKVCQYCNEAKIDVLTECSHLSCTECFHGGIQCSFPHPWTDLPNLTVFVGKGWNTAGGEHRLLLSQNAPRPPSSPVPSQTRTVPRTRNPPPGLSASSPQLTAALEDNLASDSDYEEDENGVTYEDHIERTDETMEIEASSIDLGRSSESPMTSATRIFTDFHLDSHPRSA